MREKCSLVPRAAIGAPRALGTAVEGWGVSGDAGSYLDHTTRRVLHSGHERNGAWLRSPALVKEKAPDPTATLFP
jgi:hypothetical protein